MLNWFQKQQIKPPITTRFECIINYITPSPKETKEILLADIYTTLHSAKLSVEMPSELFFINRNSITSGRNTPIDVVEGSIEAVANIDDDMESNPDAFANASETE